MIAFDRDLAIACVNPAAERTLGYSARELIGEHYDVVRPVDAEARAQRFQEVVEHGAFDGRVRVLSNGEAVYVDMRCKAVHLPDDGIEYLTLFRPIAAVSGIEPATVSRIEPLHTLEEAAVLLRKSTRTVRRLLHSGALRGSKVGGTWRIAEGALLELLTDAANGHTGTAGDS